MGCNYHGWSHKQSRKATVAISIITVRDTPWCGIAMPSDIRNISDLIGARDLCQLKRAVVV